MRSAQKGRAHVSQSPVELTGTAHEVARQENASTSQSQQRPPKTYDIGIWEEIRSTVSWKTHGLVENINKEIPKDRSLAEFHGKQPVPWQLRDVMEQRANAWVQRIYGICCGAYKNSGKALSPDFERAVWAYCIEPFIMRQRENDIHHETMSGFLELLLCAVGSPREKRRFLTVSQKDCSPGQEKCF